MRTLTVLLVATIVFSLTGIANAGQFGASEPIANPGKFSVGAGYFYSQTEFKSFDVTIGNVASTVDKPVLKSNQLYFQGSYAFCRYFEEYLRVGVADAGDMMSDKMRLSAAFGLRSHFKVNDWFALGPFLQFNWYSDSVDSQSYAATAGGAPVTAKVSVDYVNPWDFNLGLAMQAKAMGVLFYGGPVIYWQRARVDTQLQTSVGNAGAGSTDSSRVHEKANVGGFVGVRVPLSKQLKLEVEGQYKERFSAGATLSYAF